MPVRANIEPLRWESDFFGFSSGKLVFDPAAPALSSAGLDAFKVVQAKVAAHCPHRLDALATLGFRLVEGETDLSIRPAYAAGPAEGKPAESTSAAGSMTKPDNESAAGSMTGPDNKSAAGPVAASHNQAFAVTARVITKSAAPDGALTSADIRLAGAADIPALRSMASTAFTLSRFRAPWYGGTDSRRFYAQWAQNAVLGRFDHRCLVVGPPDAVIGMVTLRDIFADEVRIGLLAVDPAFGGRGIGRLLFNAALAWCREHRKQRLRVATQTGNIAALRLYIACGATIDSAAYWLYRTTHDSV